MADILSFHWLGNSVAGYVTAVGVFGLCWLVLYGVQKLITTRARRLAERTRTNIDNAVVNILETIKPPFYWYVSFYIALQWLVIQGAASRAVYIILVAWIVYQVVIALQIFIQFLIRARFARQHGRAGEVVTGILTAIVRVSLWAIGILFVLSNVGVDVTSLIAGLGIGGLAVALAARKILEDLLSSLAIYFDHPFAPGDYIAFGDNEGTVQKVGIRSTRIISLRGEEIIIPNTDITAGRIRNYRHMKERRVSFTISIAHDTPTDKVKQVPVIIGNVFTNITNGRFDRAHLISLGQSSMDFEVVYYVTNRGFKIFADIHQQVLLNIKEALAKEAITVVSTGLAG